MIGALAKGMEAGAWAFGAVLIFAAGALLVLLGVAGLAWMFGDGEDAEGMEPRDEEGFERPENGTERRFQREGAGRPMGEVVDTSSGSDAMNGVPTEGSGRLPW